MGIIKTRREIELLKKSAEITNSCIPVIEEALRENKITEKEIARRIGEKIRSKNASLAFRPIVACGKRSKRIHPKPRSTNKIISGIGLVDFGACYRGYRTDATVPFIKGKISKKEEKIVNSVLQAYEIAIKSIKIGMPCWKLFEKVDNFLRKRRFQMSHSLGHGIGLKVHELPYIGIPHVGKILKKLKGKKRERFEKILKKKLKKWEEIKKFTFQENMVFTIEPAVYVKGLGGCRLENDILIERKSIKILTDAKLIEI